MQTEETTNSVTLHPLFGYTMAKLDVINGVRVTCRVCQGAGCDDPNCENGTEVLPF